MATSLEELSILRLAENVGDDVWSLVKHWRSFQLAQLGKQINTFVRSLKQHRTAKSNGRYLRESSVIYGIPDELTIFSMEDLNWLDNSISNLQSPRKAIHD